MVLAQRCWDKLRSVTHCRICTVLEYSLIMAGPTVSLSGRIEREGVRGKGVSLEGVKITVGGGSDAYLFPQ